MERGIVFVGCRMGLHCIDLHWMARDIIVIEEYDFLNRVWATTWTK
jgi:hypothetical protein